MGRSVFVSKSSDPVRTLDEIRATGRPPLKSPSEPVEASDRVGPIARQAVIKHYGTVKEAAWRLGEGAGLAPLDPSLLMRELEAGKLSRLDVDPAVVAAVARALSDTYAPMSTPAARLRQKAREVRAIADELDQLSEFIA